MEPVGAPADERVARRRLRSGPATSRQGLVWLFLLGGVLVLQRFPVGWQLENGRLRAGVHLLAWIVGCAIGWSGRLRPPVLWTTWPPEGALYERSVRRGWDDLLADWWQYLWAVPAVVVFASILAAVGLLGVVRPREMAGMLHAGDVLWHVAIALALGDALSRELMRPRAEAVTARGLHVSPVSFVRWRQLSHAVVDRAAGAIRIFTRRRPWLPVSTLSFDTAADLDDAAGMIGDYLPLLAAGEESLANRVRWRLFLGAWIGAVAGLCFVGLLLLLLPGEVVRAHWLASVLQQMPEVTLALMLVFGDLLAGLLARLRGVRIKRIVSEAS